MNKLGLLLLAVCSISSAFAQTCSIADHEIFKGKDLSFVDFKDECLKATENQIQKEITASLKYLWMASFFARDSVNRPGFAKFFFEAAGEEREHAFKLIEYLTMRGRYLDLSKTGSSNLIDFDISKLIRDADKLDNKLLDVKLTNLTTTIDDSKTSNGLIALQNALKLEIKVTESIRALIITCESDKKDDFNHYHFVDHLTAEFLEEQYKGQRDLAGKITTLGKMLKEQGGKLADFLFDKQLL